MELSRELEWRVAEYLDSELFDGSLWKFTPGDSKEWDYCGDGAEQEGVVQLVHKPTGKVYEIEVMIFVREFELAPEPESEQIVDPDQLALEVTDESDT